MTAAAADSPSQLSEAARALGVDLAVDRADLLFRYLDLLYRWNDYAGLTRVARPQAPVLHLLDSLAVAPSLGDVHDLADLGTGAGLPGIPLAILLPRLTVALVEVRRRRCSFLAEVVDSLGISNAVVLEADAGALGRGGHRFDGIVSRAFLPPPELLAVATPILRPGGRIFVLAASLTDAELDELARREGLLFEEARRFHLPNGDPRLVASFQGNRRRAPRRAGACFT